MNTLHPTLHPTVNALLHTLLERVQAILGQRFVGMYLDGSLTSGAFDGASDVDFVVVSDDVLPNELFLSLQTMHDQVATLDSPWAIQLEGSYVPLRALRRNDLADAQYPNIERGQGERLKLVQHDAWWVVHRYIVRERGITLAGPPPQALIDPVSPDDLRRSMLSMLPEWTGRIVRDPALITHRGYQSYMVLSLCRALYTLQHGAVVSKPAAARWAQESLGERWAPLIERALAGRHEPESPASAADVSETIAFIHHTLESVER